MQFDLKTYLKENTKKKSYQVKAYRRTENFEQEIENFLVFMSDSPGPMWEVFVQKKAGQPFVHCGNLHAYDKEMALQNALTAHLQSQQV